tara:strand:- start:126 stop:1493 length:1368 start_codon:yes stop_codon:yes gene_type:complete
MYRDAKLFSGTDYHPISISNTGMGLISLCIADAMGWINNGSELALATLKTATGNTTGFTPDRTSNGYYRHFMDVTNGDQAFNSEYSTIDTDILVAGALFSMKYFQNNNITQYAMELWNSIDFDAAIATPSTGQIYLSMNADGSGDSNGITIPYNEYMLVAWFAKNYSSESDSVGTVLWDNHYSSATSLPTISYDGNTILTDHNTSFLSSFTHQFNYYLCNYFTTSNDYLTFFKSAQEADKSWWKTTENSSFEWGLGAGSAITTSYHADAINNNEDIIVSPHIIAGYIPVNPSGKNDLINLWNNSPAKYSLPTADNDPILWRYTNSNTMWMPNEIIGVDHASMLFGLSTLPEYLGSDFFPDNNDFFPFPTLNTPQFSLNQKTKVYPNPTTNQITIQLDKQYENISILISNTRGQAVFSKALNRVEKIKIPIKIESGLYFLNIKQNEGSKTFKIIIQ